MKGLFDPKGVSIQRLRTSGLQAAAAAAVEAVAAVEAAAAACTQAVKMPVFFRQLAQLCLYIRESKGNV